MTNGLLQAVRFGALPSGSQGCETCGHAVPPSLLSRADEVIE